MVTGGLRNYTDENIIEIIGSLKEKSVSYNLNDLKAVLAEVNTRHLEGDYAEVLGELIRERILSGETVVATKVAEPKEEIQEETVNEEQPIKEPKIKKEKKDKVKKIQEIQAEIEEDDEGTFPVLNFMTGFLKVFGWVMFCISIGYGLVASVTEHLSEVRLAIGSIFTGLVVGTVILLLCYWKSESIALKLEIEKSLKKLSKDQ